MKTNHKKALAAWFLSTFFVILVSSIFVFILGENNLKYIAITGQIILPLASIYLYNEMKEKKEK